MDSMSVRLARTTSLVDPPRLRLLLLPTEGDLDTSPKDRDLLSDAACWLIALACSLSHSALLWRFSASAAFDADAATATAEDDMDAVRCAGTGGAASASDLWAGTGGGGSSLSRVTAEAWTFRSGEGGRSI